MSQVCEGDLVCIHYRGRLADGSVFDDSHDGEPLEFIAGGQELIEGVSQAVLGMAEGEEKTVVIPPEKGYGHPDPALRQSVPHDEMPGPVSVGDQLRAVHEEQEMIVWVAEVNDEHVVVDANHPLAGQTLTFDLEVVSIRPAGE